MTSTSTSSSNPTTTTTTAENVLLYIPNLIGYFRVICTISSFILMILFDNKQQQQQYYWIKIVAIILYILSFVGDLFDGMIARKFNQCSEFGGLLDMITDRCSTMGLLCILSTEYSNEPIKRITFLFLALLDISSHWCQMYSTCALGQHHKSDEGNVNRNFLVRWFYKYYWFFGYLCVGAEFTYICSYALLLQFTTKQQNYDNDNDENSDFGVWCHTIIKLLLIIFLPGCILKQAVNIMQLLSACYAVAQHDADMKNK